jgi:hypothetical protein
MPFGIGDGEPRFRMHGDVEPRVSGVEHRAPPSPGWDREQST